MKQETKESMKKMAYRMHITQEMSDRLKEAKQIMKNGVGTYAESDYLVYTIYKELAKADQEYEADKEAARKELLAQKEGRKYQPLVKFVDDVEKGMYERFGILHIRKEKYKEIRRRYILSGGRFGD